MGRLLFFVLILMNLVAGAQVLDRADLAFHRAATEGRPVLLIFAGSDWCLPCIRFEHRILADTAFQRFASANLVLLYADFPQRKKLSSSLIAQNDSLAARYDPNGIFPLFLLLKPDESVLTSVSYEDQSPEEFIGQIRSRLGQAHMLKEYTRREKRMGSAFEFIVVAEDEAQGIFWLDLAGSEVSRIENLLTEFREDSMTSLINREAGCSPVQAGEEMYNLIERCRNLSRLTGGAFDITAGLLKGLYRFSGESFEMPSAERIQEALSKTGYEKIRLIPPGGVFLNQLGMRIGFGAIGKGYAADRVKALLAGEGAVGGVINASGDLTAWGSRADRRPWKTGIAHPDEISRVLLWLPLQGLSVATSGNYIQYFDRSGVRYAHTIDPQSGRPVTGIKSVSVISPSAELSDALATAVTVMGRKAGLHLIDQLPQTHAIIVDEHNHVFNSKKITILHAV